MISYVLQSGSSEFGAAAIVVVKLLLLSRLAAHNHNQVICLHHTFNSSPSTQLNSISLPLKQFSAFYSLVINSLCVVCA